MLLSKFKRNTQMFSTLRGMIFLAILAMCTALKASNKCDDLLDSKIDSAITQNSYSSYSKEELEELKQLAKETNDTGLLSEIDLFEKQRDTSPIPSGSKIVASNEITLWPQGGKALQPLEKYRLPKLNKNPNDHIEFISLPKDVIKELSKSDQKQKKFYSAIERGLVYADSGENGIKALKGAKNAFEIKHTSLDARIWGCLVNGVLVIKGVSDHKNLSKVINCP